MPTTVENLEREIAHLPQDQLKNFRRWYEKFDARIWDEQIEQDVSGGKLDQMADAAIAEHRAGKTKRL
jgi:hypothetical protein